MSDETVPPPPPSPPPAPTPAPAPVPASPPPPTAAVIPTAAPTAPSALWSLILGILSFVCGGFITAIPAIICGHVGRSAIRKSGGALGGGGMAMAGLILGYIALVLNILIIPAILIPAFVKARQEVREHHDETASVDHADHVSIDGKEVVATDGKARMTVPKSWKDLPGLNEKASLQVGDEGKAEYLMVLSEAQSDFDGMTLEKHHQLTRDAMLKKMKNSSATEPESVTIGGKEALQDELSGTQNGTNIVFLHTTVDDGEYFHQILAWTIKSRWDQHNGELRKITESFRTEE